MKKIISIILVLVIAVGTGGFLWSKDAKEKKQEAEAKIEAYEVALGDTLELINTSTLNSTVLAATYQEYWGAIIKNDIDFSVISKLLNVEEPTLREMTGTGKTAFLGMGNTGLKKGEFDTIISMVALGKKNETNEILAQQTAITEAIKGLKNPPEQFKESYDQLLEVYELYDTFASMATSPSGSYVNYSSGINSTFESLSSKIKTLELKL